MSFASLHLGDFPRKNPVGAIFVAVCVSVITAASAVTALIFLMPIRPGGIEVDPWTTFLYWDESKAEILLRVRLIFLTTVTAGIATYWRAWSNTPLADPFIANSHSDPKLFYQEKARWSLMSRLYAEAGSEAKTGVYLAPYLPLPFSAESKNVLVVGSPESGKSNILRALAEQSIDRGDRVLMLCTKGEVTACFTDENSIIIAAHHRDSFALDLGADVVGPAAALQLAADIVPEGNTKFWSDSARILLTDIIISQQLEHGQDWNARSLLKVAISDTDLISSAIDKIDISASPLIANNSEDGEDRTVRGIVITMQSAVFTALRPLAWAWDNSQTTKRFSIKRWLDGKHAGPTTVLMQYSADYARVSTLVSGILLRTTARHVADPRFKVSTQRRVVLVLDEFHVLDRIERFEESLALGREKGLVVFMGIQSPLQLEAKYKNAAKLVLDLFQIKIYGRQTLGETSKKMSVDLGERSVKVREVNTHWTKDGDPKHISDRRFIPVFSATRLASELGVFKTGTTHIKALVQCYGHCYLLEWPLTVWKPKRQGFIPAAWIDQTKRSK